MTSSETVNDYYNYCREVYSHIAENESSKQSGGEGGGGGGCGGARIRLYGRSGSKPDLASVNSKGGD